jgi:Ribbon-helix-helix protein, copG family
MYLDQETAERLSAAANAAGQSRSAFARRAIGDALPPSRGPFPQSWFDLLGTWEDDRTPEEILHDIRDCPAQRPGFTTSRRWHLKDGSTESQLLALVHEEIVPAYRRLSRHVILGLQRIDGTLAYLTTQGWPTRTEFQLTMTGPAYEAWLESYKPALAAWHELMELESEWETEQLL